MRKSWTGARNSFEFARALLLGDEEPGDLALDVQGDEDRARLGRRLDPRRHIRRFAKHLPGRVNDDQAALDADTRG